MPGIKYPLAHDPMLGKGLILFDRFDASGNPSGLFPFGNCTKLELVHKDERANLFQSINKSASLIATGLKKRTVSVSIVGTDFRSDMMAIAMMSAGKTQLVSAVATVTAEVLAAAGVAKAGKFFQFAQSFIDNVTTPPVLTNNALVLVAGTDYNIVDTLEGLVYFPTGTTADTAHAVTATYHTLVGTLDQVAGATQPQIVGRLHFSPDPTDGQKIGLDAWRVNLYPSGQLGLIADDFGNWTLDGEVLDDSSNHPNSPYYLQTFYP